MEKIDCQHCCFFSARRSESNIVAPKKLLPQNMLLVLECDGDSKIATYYTKLM